MSLPVSIVIPTHNRPELLEKTLQSIQNQTYPHELLEIIIVPTEDDPGIITAQSFKDKSDIKVICIPIPQDPWHGRSASAKRNHGVRHAQHSWIAFIDDDCVADLNWIKNASHCFNSPNLGAIEGKVKIPSTHPMTLTYKGMLRLSDPGGYQTCNMFYNKSVFIQVGGFDTKFPFYLEDTDLAWSVLDAKKEIFFAEDAIVTHPVSPPEPMRLLAAAKRARIIPYLYKKHPLQFNKSRMQAFKRSHWYYIFIYGLIMTALILGNYTFLAVSALTLFALTALHLMKMFKGCKVETNEFLITAALTPIVPVISLFQILRGSLENKVWVLLK